MTSPTLLRNVSLGRKVNNKTTIIHQTVNIINFINSIKLT